jgi:Mg-chelatase subunit ChlD
MNNDGGTPPEPITSVLSAAKSFVDRLGENDQGGLVTYATLATRTSDLTKDRAGLSTKVASLTISPEAETGGTNIGDAIKRALEMFGSPLHNPDARKVLVLFTDGLANEPGETPEQYALDEATVVKNAGVEVFTIGLGTELNETFLRSIATDDAHYFNAPTTNVIESVYSSITKAICEEGAAVIDIVPKTNTNFAPLQ